MKSGPTLAEATASPRLRKAAISPVATVVFPTPEWVPEITTLGPSVILGPTALRLPWSTRSRPCNSTRARIRPSWRSWSDVTRAAVTTAFDTGGRSGHKLRLVDVAHGIIEGPSPRRRSNLEGRQYP